MVQALRSPDHLPITLTASFGYRYESTRVFNIDVFAPPYVKDQFGTLITSAITLGLAKNTINDVMNPTKGINTRATIDWAGGPLRGDNYFVRFVASYGQFFPWKFLDSTFFIRGTAGTIQAYGGKPIPIYENFFVGGIDSVRRIQIRLRGARQIIKMIPSEEKTNSSLMESGYSQSLSLPASKASYFTTLVGVPTTTTCLRAMVSGAEQAPVSGGNHLWVPYESDSDLTSFRKKGNERVSLISQWAHNINQEAV